MRSFLFATILFAALLSSCATVPVGVRVYDAEYDTSVSFDKDRKIELTEVLEDSRCPVDAQCAWAGEVVMRFRVIDNNVDTSFFVLTFDNGKLESEDIEILDIYSLQVTDVDPDPESNVEIDDEDYTCRLVVEKLERK